MSHARRIRPARDTRGAVAVLSASLGAVLIGFAGLAVDTTRAWVAEARMKSALDAAALVAARRFTAADRDAVATQAFWANLEQASGRRAFVGATYTDPVFTEVAGQTSQIRATARVTTPTTLFNVISAQTIVRNEVSVARRGAGLELAIAIDTTSSMNATVASLGNITKLRAAQNAANRLVNLLYGCRETGPTDTPPNSWVDCRETQTNLFISVIPFSRNLNIGTGANSALDLTTAPLNTANVPTGWESTDFNGCVEARIDLTDDAPTTTALRLRPFAWPSTFRQVGRVDQGACTTGNAWPTVRINGQDRRFCFGDNDWNRAVHRQTGEAELSLTTHPMVEFLTTSPRNLPASMASGPNLLCTPSRMIPLTARRTQVRDAINALQSFGASGGTVIAPALQGAWYALSPNWRGFWTNTNFGVPDLPPLPRDYETPNNVKAVILLSDGDNNWNSRPITTVRSAPSGVTERYYTAFGRVQDWNEDFPARTIDAGRAQEDSPDGADFRLNQLTAQLCTNMKASAPQQRDRIRIYVIGFEVLRSSHQTLLENCASVDNGRRLYFPAANAGELDGVFREIAADLVRLRLVE